MFSVLSFLQAHFQNFLTGPKSFWTYRRTWQKLQFCLKNVEAEIQIFDGVLTLILAFCHIRLFEKINPLSTIGPTIVISKRLEMFFDDIPQRFSCVSRIVIVEQIQLCGWNVQDLNKMEQKIFLKLVPVQFYIPIREHS